MLKNPEIRYKNDNLREIVFTEVVVIRQKSTWNVSIVSPLKIGLVIIVASIIKDWDNS